MKRTILGLPVLPVLIMCASLAGRVANADNPPGTNMPPEPQQMRGKVGATVGKVEPNKHLSEVDLYLKDAMNNTRALYQATQLAPGKLDVAIERESVANIDKAITGALTHIGHVKTLPEAQVGDMKDVNAVQTDLNQARTILGQLRRDVGAGSSADRAMISSTTSQLYATLKTADESFGKLADQTNLTRVDQINVPEKQPVGGSAPPAGEGSEGGGTQPKGGDRGGDRN